MIASSGFLAVQPFLDDQASARVAEHELPRDLVDGVQRLRAPRADDHSLAGSQAVGLDHHRHLLIVFGVAVLDEAGGTVRIAKRLIVGGGHIRGPQQVLAEDLAAFQLRRRFRGTEDPQLGFLERIDDAGGQRRLGTDHRELHAVLARELDELRDVAGRERDVLRILFGAGIAGGDKHMLDVRALSDLPGQGMFPAAVANNQDVHDGSRLIVPPTYRFHHRRMPDSRSAQAIPRGAVAHGIDSHASPAASSCDA